VGAPSPGKPVQVLVRVPPETYAALQLAMAFQGQRSMQALVRKILEDHISALRRSDSGYAHALVDLAESRAREAGVLARRTASRGRADGR
jgi:hypothetical protein